MEQHSPIRKARKSFADNNVASILKVGNDMARKRYQYGQVYEKHGIWYGRYYESVLMPDGGEYRIRRNEPLGKFPTKKLAQRALEPRLAELNARSYRPLRQGTWKEFAEQWQETMLENYKPSAQQSIKSRLKVLSYFDKIPLDDLSNLDIQRFISKSKLAPKTVRNNISLMHSMWRQAKAWQYARHNPFEGVVLPRLDDEEQPTYSPEQVRRIIQALLPPYSIVVRVLAETGIRRGEVCGLNVGDVNFTDRFLTIQRSRWRKHLTSPKSRKTRTVPISDALVKTLTEYTRNRKPEDPLFLSAKGKRLDPDNLVKRILKPVLKQLGFEGACHAFRHGNITQMGRQQVSPAIMQARVGHADFDTTMIYMHVVSDDARALANALGELYDVKDLATMETKGGKQ